MNKKRFFPLITLVVVVIITIAALYVKNNYDKKAASQNSEVVKEKTEAEQLIKEAKALTQSNSHQEAIEKFEKAHQLDSTLFDDNTYHLMALTYYTMDNHPMSIKYFEKAETLEKRYKGLVFIYGRLSESYTAIKNYTKAIEYANKLSNLSNTEEDTAYSYYLKGEVYFSQDKIEKSIQNYEKSVEHTLKHLSATMSDVENHKIKDDKLGEIFFRLGILHSKLEDSQTSNKYVIQAAAVGHKHAIELCEEKRMK